MPKICFIQVSDRDNKTIVRTMVSVKQSRLAFEFKRKTWQKMTCNVAIEFHCDNSLCTNPFSCAYRGLGHETKPVHALPHTRFFSFT